jgi:hypothetical protein
MGEGRTHVRRRAAPSERQRPALLTIAHRSLPLERRSHARLDGGDRSRSA